MTLAERLSSNLSFSQSTPGLQLSWDSTSLGEFKQCPRKYELSILWGWQPRGGAVDLEWGILVHSGTELYRHHRAAQEAHEGALRCVVQWALQATWDTELGRPQSWPDPEKNRLTLIRALVWYCDQWKNDPLETVLLDEGKPATELSFKFDSGYASAEGEPYLLCGHLDRVVTLQGAAYIVDLKTTRYALDSRYFAQFSPDNQFSLYSLAARQVWHQPVQGLIVDGLQVGATFVRSHRQLIARPPEVLEEWYEGLQDWLELAERYARRGRWPQNDKACHLYRGCQFRSVCSAAPAGRAAALAMDFVQRAAPGWDPMIPR